MECKMTKTEKAIGKIYGLAAEHRISMINLTEAAGVTRVTLSNWRSGRTSPTLEKYLDVQDALDEMIADKKGV